VTPLPPLPPLRIATRGSDLALAQARWVAARVTRELGRAAELVTIVTSGDRLQTVSLAKVGGKGLFVKEIEEALLERRADLAVHSAKDLPAATPAGLVLAAFPDREDPRDALVCRVRGATLSTLPRGARIGTGSVRRAAQLRAHRPDVEVVPLRGNVPTRLRKLESERLDAVVLACAGLGRLGLADRIDERIAPEVLLPAVAQGTLALETRAGDPLAAEIARLGDPVAEATAAAERAFQRRLEGDCSVPLAGFAELEPGGVVRLRGLVSDAAGGRVVRGEGRSRAPEEAGVAAAEAVLAGGGESILAALRAEAGR
jgi:hydroxymethylbilane synthase